MADGREFTAMCAIDAMGAAFTFHQDTEVHSVCAMCEEPVYVKIVDGKLKIGYPINWDKTIKLWYKDEEARKNKTLLRYEPKYIYHIKYNKYHAMYENQVFYEFDVNRFIKRALVKSINNGKTDTLW